ncbi:thioredoxin domain-containing protein [Niabella terrae]
MEAQTQTSYLLDVAAFSVKLEQLPDGVILDVRTPEEYAGEHLDKAVNFNWQDPAFADNVAKMDKKAPVFVYCLSGGRSAAAAKKLREKGFQEVYEMQGGMLKWKASELPLVQGSPSDTTREGMNRADFKAALQTDKLVLVDFYAPWCAPCKKMKPFLEEIAKTRAETLQLIRIDIDANPQLAEALHIQELPLLHLYKKQERVWVQKGYIDKKGLLEKLPQ